MYSMLSGLFKEGMFGLVRSSYTNPVHETRNMCKSIAFVTFKLYLKYLTPLVQYLIKLSVYFYLKFQTGCIS